jgi:hypothetical protein
MLIGIQELMKEKEEVGKSGLMVVSTKDSGTMIKLMEWAGLFMQTVMFMKVIG